MGLFDGLSKFGMQENIGEEIGDGLFLTSREKEQAKLGRLKNGSDGKAENDGMDKMSEEERLLLLEKNHLFRRNISCVCCDKVFPALVPRSGHVKRLESDRDLRPRCENFDTLKYGAYHCPYCGYTAVARNFPRLSSHGRKEIINKICSQFKPEPPMDTKETITYEEAIDYHKLALFTEVVKDGKVSDKAYVCLLLGWLYRGKREELERNDQADENEIEECRTQEKECLCQAYEGFLKAFSKEAPPFAGMDELTTEYLISALGVEIGRYDVAAKSISHIMLSKSAPSRMKDKARMLKEEIIMQIRSKKQNASV